MSYCEYQDIIDLTGTDLDDRIITRLISKADRRIKRTLIREGLGTTLVPVPDNIAEASAHFAAALVLRRHMVDGTLPATNRIGDVGATVKVEDAIKQFEAEGEEYLREYIDENGEEYSPYRIVGRGGERVGEYDTMDEDLEEEA
jgi:hypothetical protein